MAVPTLKQVVFTTAASAQQPIALLSLLTNALEHRAQPAIMGTKKLHRR